MNLGNLDIILGINTQGLMDGLAKAFREVQKWTQDTAQLGKALSAEFDKSFAAKSLGDKLQKDLMAGMIMDRNPMLNMISSIKGSFQELSNTLASVGQSTTVQKLVAPFEKLQQEVQKTTGEIKNLEVELTLLAKREGEIRASMATGGFTPGLARTPVNVAAREQAQAQIAKIEAAQAKLVAPIPPEEKFQAGWQTRRTSEEVQSQTQYTEKLKEYNKEQEKLNQQKEKYVQILDHQSKKEDSIKAVTDLKTIEQERAGYHAKLEVEKAKMPGLEEEARALQKQMVDIPIKDQLIERYNTLTGSLKTYGTEILDLNSKLAAHKEMQQNIVEQVQRQGGIASPQQSEAFVKHGQAIKQLNEDIKNHKSQLPGLQEEYKNLQTRIAGWGDGVMALREKQSDLSKAMGNLQQQTRLQGHATKEQEAQMGDLAKQHDKVTTSLKQLDSTMGRTKMGFKELMAWQLEWYASAGLLFGVFGQAKQAIANMVEFEQRIINMKAIVQATTLEADQLALTARRIGTESRFSANEVADAMTILGQAGLSARETIDSMNAVVALATSTLVSMKIATDLITTGLRAFDKEASESADIANVMAAATNASKLTMEGLAVAFNYVGVVGAQAGLSLEEVTAAMGVMADRGIRASTIGTSLKSILGLMVAPTARFKEEIERVGLKMKDVNPLGNDFGVILDRLAAAGFNVDNAFHGLDKRMASGMIALVQAHDSYKLMVKAVTDTNYAFAMQEEQLGTVQSNWMMLSNNITELGLKISTVVLPPINLLLKTLKDTAKGFNDWATSLTGAEEKVATFAGTLAVWVGGILLLTTVIGPFITSLFALDKSLEAVGAKLRALKWATVFSPLTVIIAVIGSIITFFGILIQNTDKLNKEFLELNKQTSTTATVLGELDKELSKAKDGSKELQAITARLVSLYPELKDEMKKFGDSTDYVKGKIAELVEEANRLWLATLNTTLALKQLEALKITTKTYTGTAETGQLEAPTGIEGYFKTESKIAELKRKGDILTEQTRDPLKAAEANVALRENEEAIKKNRQYLAVIESQVELILNARRIGGAAGKSAEVAIRTALDAQKITEEEVDSIITKKTTPLEPKKKVAPEERPDKAAEKVIESISDWIEKKYEALEKVSENMDIKLHAEAAKRRGADMGQELETEFQLRREARRKQWDDDLTALDQHAGAERTKVQNLNKEAQARIAVQLKEGQRIINEWYGIILPQDEKQFDSERVDSRRKSIERLVDLEKSLGARLDSEQLRYNQALLVAARKRMSDGERERSQHLENLYKIQVEYNKELAAIQKTAEYEKISKATSEQLAADPELRKQKELYEINKSKLDQEKELKILTEDATSIERLQNLGQLGGRSPWEAFTQGIKNADNELSRFGKAFTDLGEYINKGFVDGVSTAFTEFANGTKTASDAFKDFAKTFLTEINKMIARLAMMYLYESMFGKMTKEGVATAGFLGKGGLGTTLEGFGEKAKILMGLKASEAESPQEHLATGSPEAKQQEEEALSTITKEEEDLSDVFKDLGDTLKGFGKDLMKVLGITKPEIPGAPGTEISQEEIVKIGEVAADKQVKAADVQKDVSIIEEGLTVAEEALTATKEVTATTEVSAATTLQAVSVAFMEAVAVFSEAVAAFSVKAGGGGFPGIGNLFGEESIPEGVIEEELLFGLAKTGGVLPELKELRAFSSGGVTSGPALAILGDNASKKELVIPSENIQQGKVSGYTREKGGEAGLVSRASGGIISTIKEFISSEKQEERIIKRASGGLISTIKEFISPAKQEETIIKRAGGGVVPQLRLIVSPEKQEVTVTHRAAGGLLPSIQSFFGESVKESPRVLPRATGGLLPTVKFVRPISVEGTTQETPGVISRATGVISRATGGILPSVEFIRPTSVEGTTKETPRVIPRATGGILPLIQMIRPTSIRGVTEETPGVVSRAKGGTLPSVEFVQPTSLRSPFSEFINMIPRATGGVLPPIRLVRPISIEGTTRETPSILSRATGGVLPSVKFVRPLSVEGTTKETPNIISRAVGGVLPAIHALRSFFIGSSTEETPGVIPRATGGILPSIRFTRPVSIEESSKVISRLTGGILPNVLEFRSFSSGGMTSRPALALLGDNASKKELVIPSENIKEDSAHGYTRDKDQNQGNVIINLFDPTLVPAIMAKYPGATLNIVNEDIMRQGITYQTIQSANSKRGR